MSDISEYQAYEGVCPNCAAILSRQEVDMNHCLACGWPDEDEPYDDWSEDEEEDLIADSICPECGGDLDVCGHGIDLYYDYYDYLLVDDDDDLHYDPNKDVFVQARERAVREMRADYEISKQSRIEVGMTIRTYEEWLEDQLQVNISLKSYYQERQSKLLTFCKKFVDMHEHDEYPSAEFAFRLNDLRDWLKENGL